MHDAEHGSVQADADGKRQNGYSRDERRPHQLA
jgi:hypothetical protein